jgi:DNA-binding XRE family transcriptional regulator
MTMALADEKPAKEGGAMGHKRQINEARAVRLYQKGLTLQEVARQVGRSEDWVRTRLERAGVPRRRRGRPLQTDVPRAIELYRELGNVGKVADEMGGCKSRIWAHLKKAGVMASGAEAQARRYATKRGRVLEAWQHGLTVVECAREAGCSQDTASRTIRRAGFDPRAHSRSLADCGPLIRSVREEAGLNQTQLARLIGTRPRRICDFERGYHRPTLRMLRRIARGLVCSNRLPPTHAPLSQTP